MSTSSSSVVTSNPGSAGNNVVKRKQSITEMNGSKFQAKVSAKVGEKHGKVIHLRNLPKDCSDHEVVALAFPHGKIVNMLIMKPKKQAFIEFETKEVASNFFNYGTTNSIILRNHIIYLQGCNYETLKTKKEDREQLSSYLSSIVIRNPSRVLHVVIDNVTYPVTLDTIYTLFTLYGTLERTAIFTKGEKYHALVQMSALPEAITSKIILDGQCIYTGCNAMSVLFSSLSCIEIVPDDNTQYRDFVKNPMSKTVELNSYNPAFNPSNSDLQESSLTNGLDSSIQTQNHYESQQPMSYQSNGKYGQDLNQYGMYDNQSYNSQNSIIESEKSLTNNNIQNNPNDPIMINHHNNQLNSAPISNSASNTYPPQFTPNQPHGIPQVPPFNMSSNQTSVIQPNQPNIGQPQNLPQLNIKQNAPAQLSVSSNPSLGLPQNSLPPQTLPPPPTQPALPSNPIPPIHDVSYPYQQATTTTSTNTIITKQDSGYPYQSSNPAQNTNLAKNPDSTYLYQSINSGSNSNLAQIHGQQYSYQQPSLPSVVNPSQVSDKTFSYSQTNPYPHYSMPPTQSTYPTAVATVPVQQQQTPSVTNPMFNQTNLSSSANSSIVPDGKTVANNIANSSHTSYYISYYKNQLEGSKDPVYRNFCQNQINYLNQMSVNSAYSSSVSTGYNTIANPTYTQTSATIDPNTYAAAFNSAASAALATNSDPSAAYAAVYAAAYASNFYPSSTSTLPTNAIPGVSAYPGQVGFPMSNPKLVNGVNPYIIFIRNLPTSIVADDLEVLCGHFGDVKRIKILYNKRDSAMVEFFTPQMANLAVSSLHGVLFGSKKLMVGLSKFPEITQVRQDVDTPFLSGEYEDSADRHRFRQANFVNFTNIFPPSNSLHISNIPKTYEDADIEKLFKDHGVEFIAYKSHSRPEVRMGFATFESTSKAIYALIKMHNFTLVGGNKLRVSFAKSHFP